MSQERLTSLCILQVNFPLQNHLFNAKNRLTGWSDEHEELMLVKNTTALGYSPPQVFPPTSSPLWVRKDPSDTGFCSFTISTISFQDFSARCFSSHLLSKKRVLYLFFSFVPFLCAVITPFPNTHSFSSFFPTVLSSLLFILLTHTVGYRRHWQELLSQTGTHNVMCMQEL